MTYLLVLVDGGDGGGGSTSSGGTSSMKGSRCSRGRVNWANSKILSIIKPYT